MSVTDMVADITVSNTKAIDQAGQWGVPYGDLLLISLVVFAPVDGGASVVEFRIGNGSELTTVYDQALGYAESLGVECVLAPVVASN